MWSRLLASLRSSSVPELKPHWRTGLVVVILLLAAFFRTWNIEYTPYANDGDELAYIFAGQSLWEFGWPISWTSFVAQSNHWATLSVPAEVLNQPQIFRFSQPWFDHSFAVPLVMGGWSEVLGYSFPAIPPAALYRLPMVGLAIITLALCYGLARRWFGEEAALVVLVLLSFSPSLMLIQRMVVPENFLAPAFLAALYAQATDRPWWQVAVAIVLAGLMKVTGLLALPIVAAHYWFTGQKRAAGLVVVTALLGVGLLLASYGFSLDGQAWWQAQRHQSARLIGWSNPAFIVASPGFHNFEWLDASYYIMLLAGLGLVGAAASAAGTKSDDQAVIPPVLVLSILGWFATVWVTSAEQDMLGWYKIPLFLCLGIASGWWWQQKRWLPLLLSWGVMILSNAGLIRYPSQPLPEAMVVRVAVAIGLASTGLVLYSKKHWPRLATGVMAIFMAIYVWQAWWVADQYFAATCHDRLCQTPTVTLKGSLKSALKEMLSK